VTASRAFVLGVLVGSVAGNLVLAVHLHGDADRRRELLAASRGVERASRNLAAVCLDRLGGDSTLVPAVDSVPFGVTVQ
jgi:hypothetical protein